MATTLPTDSARPWWHRFTPRTGVRVQLVAAALLWLVGTSFLLVRGVLFIEEPGPHSHFNWWILPIAALAIAIGLVKARFILIRYATKAVARIRARGHACFFGFFAPTSWLFIIVMMGGGILLRSSPLVDYWWGRVALSTLYLAVGTALLIADVVFWRAVVRSFRHGAEAPGGDVPAGDLTAADPPAAEAPPASAAGRG